MNNVVNKEVQPRISRINLAQGKARVITLLNASDTLAERIVDHDPELIRKYRDRLSHGKHMLDKPEHRSLCVKLIKLFNIELRARAAEAPHERYLKKKLG